MKSVQDLFGKAQQAAQTHLAPAAASATSSLKLGADIVRGGATAVRHSLRDNLGNLVNSTHTFVDSRGGELVVREVALIAEGGFGAVVRAREQRSGKDFALKKIMCTEGVQIASSLEAAESEAKILQGLPTHPGIVQCFGWATDTLPGGSQMVKILTELCPGGHLLDYLDSKDGSLQAQEVIDPFKQVTDAVRFLHSQSPPIQHRDVKVENILKDCGGRWKLCDFGSCSTERVPAVELSRETMWALQENIDKTVTMLYRPPEMADVSLNYRKGYAITEQGDLWMLGCVLYTIAFYQHPFQDNVSAMAIFNAKYFIPKDHRHAQSPKLCGLVHWLLSADPKDRPTAPQLCEIIRDLGKIPYPDFLASMPTSVQEKIQKLKDLYGARKDSDFVEPGKELGGETPAVPTAAPTRRRSTPTAATASPAAAAASPMAPEVAAAVHDNSGSESAFDLRFALATSAGSTNLAAPSPSPVSAKTTEVGHVSAQQGSQDTLATAEVDLIGFCSTNLPSASPNTSPAPASMAGLDDLLGLGTQAPLSSIAPQPASVAPEPALTPARASSATPGTACNTAGSFWNDFASFAEPGPATSPPPALANADRAQSPIAHSPAAQQNVAQQSVGAADLCDFGDFTAAPALRCGGAARAAESRAPVPVTTTANLLDL